MNEWEKESDFNNFFNIHSNRLDRLKDDFSSLAVKIRNCFELSEAVDKNPELKRALQECADHYTIRLRNHLRKLSDYMSCALLNVKKGDARLETIKKMGFTPDYNQGVRPDHMALLFIGLFVIYIIVFGRLNLSPVRKAPTRLVCKSHYDFKHYNIQHSLCYFCKKAL